MNTYMVIRQQFHINWKSKDLLRDSVCINQTNTTNKDPDNPKSKRKNRYSVKTVPAFTKSY